MDRIRKHLTKKVKRNNIDIQSPASTRDVGGRLIEQTNPTFFSGAHGFIAQGEFTHIQGNQTILNIYPPPEVISTSSCHPVQCPPDVDDTTLFKHGAIVATRVFRTKQFHFGKIYHGEIKENGESVLWKKYDEEAIKEFKRELDVWKALTHPFLVQLMGRSTPGSKSCFLVLTGAKDINIREAFTETLMTKDAAASFTDALVNLAGIYSGLLYLASQFRLDFQEIAGCMDPSNILVSPDNRAIVGRNLVNCAPSRTPMVNTEQQCNLLVSEVFGLTEYFLFGNHGTRCFGRWDATGEKREFSHLRALLRLVGWNAYMSFQTIEERVSDLADQVTSPRRPLRFSEIREALLNVPNLGHAMSFCPPKQWEIKIYDIGYVKEEKFVHLCNVQDMAIPPLPVITEDEFITLPDVRSQIKQLDSGTRRFEFNNTGTAGVDRRVNSHVIADSAQAFRFFLKITPSLIKQYGDEHHIQVSNLVMIIGYIDYPSGSGISFSDESKTPKGSFYFYALPPGSSPWGYWTTEENETGLSKGLDEATVTFVENQQYVYLLQLQEEDLQ